MTTKEMALKAISSLPDDTTFEDIHLYVLECIQNGEEDIKNNQVMTDQEVNAYSKRIFRNDLLD